jgi:hypothetical protein
MSTFPMKGNKTGTASAAMPVNVGKTSWNVTSVPASVRRRV